VLELNYACITFVFWTIVCVYVCTDPMFRGVYHGARKHKGITDDVSLLYTV